jgi:hypothetical protein
MMSSSTSRELLRHSLATLAYRGAKVLRDAPEGFALVQAAPTSRSAGEILAHIGDLLEWALWLAKGQHVWQEAPFESWEDEVARFFEGIDALDAHIAAETPLGVSPGKLFQGPIADAFTHVGQIALLRGVAGAPVAAENYFLADIKAGRVGASEAEPGREF